MEYTKAQLTAINEVDRNLQIIACAGSGKTQVVSARVIEILQRKKEEGIVPGNIVAFTYTDKAAGELKDRIHTLYHEQFGNELGLAEMFVGTTHAYCLNLLQSAPLYKFLKYQVLTDVRQRLFVDRYSVKSGLTNVPLLAGGRLERWKDSSLYQELLTILGEGVVDQTLVSPAALEAVREYHLLRNGHYYLDYTTMIGEAVTEIQQNETLRKHLSRQLKYLVVDEYQDINPLQEKLVRLLYELGANICVVGDDDQTIYQWRGSDIRHIQRFATTYPNVQEVNLNENFRSSEGVIGASRAISEGLAERLNKRMETVNAQEYSRGDLLALQFNNPQEEAKWIGRKITDLLGTLYKDRPNTEPRGLTFSDCAILLRSVRNDGGPILEALDSAGLPYIVIGMNGLFSTPEIQAIRAAFYYLGDFQGPGGSISLDNLSRIIKRSQFGVTDEHISEGMAFLKMRKEQIGQKTDATLYLQRVFLDLLEVLEVREEVIDTASGGQRKGEIVFYNFGKFSKVISDYEQIHFHSSPAELYPAFAAFLCHQAPSYYPEGWQDSGFAIPDAIQIMTVHQAKGMQWPAVFIPCLRKNRFPSKRQGGRSIWHIIPKNCVQNADRYIGIEDDERRLFYVALTRAEKFIFCTWAPIPVNRQQSKPSPFLFEFSRSDWVLTAEPSQSKIEKIEQKSKKGMTTLHLSFSELKYYFECPYLFKLRFLYGFDAPISRAIGYGKSLHDMLAEIHAEAIRGNVATTDDIPRLVSEHLHLPFASKDVEEHLLHEANEALTRYLNEYSDTLTKLEHVEKIIELRLADRIVINGRIDLIRRTDTDELVIVDFKSDERAQVEEITEKQLHIYAYGYEQLSGRRADLIEVHNLDKGGALREVVDQTMLTNTITSVHEAGIRLREDNLPRLDRWTKTCQRCDVVGICRRRSDRGDIGS
jgi:DNA helicase-2/ATP-dependent DNA helicase PcrA